MNSRNSRRLDLDSSDFKETFEDKEFSLSNPTKPRIDKSQLQELFQLEIDELVSKEILKRELKLKQDFQDKYDARVKQMEQDIASYKIEIEKAKLEFDQLMTSLKASFNQKISEDIQALDQVLIEITLQCLMKIIVHPEQYKEMIQVNIQENLEKKSISNRSSIKVSEKEYRFLKRHFQNCDWVTSLSIDDRLGDGQMLLDDGLSSVYEIGFVNQLDRLRDAFIATLRERHVI